MGDIDQRNQNEDQKKLDKDVLPFFRTMDVSAITKQTINEYLGSLADRKLSKSTRNKHVSVIRKVLKHASDSGIGCRQIFWKCLNEKFPLVRQRSQNIFGMPQYYK